MPNLRWWIVVAVLVAIAAFVTGVVRGATDTVPFEVEARADRQIPAQKI